MIDKGNKKLISVVVPVFNEELIVNELVNRLTTVASSLEEYSFEFIFINDGSKDKTLEYLIKESKEDSRINIVNFSRNFGHQNAVVAGLAESNGDAIVIIDGDLQDPPEVIPKLIEDWEKGADVVYAKRRKRKGETFFKKITAFLYYRILNYFSDANIPNDTGDFRLLDRKVVDVLLKFKEKTPFIRGIVAWIGFRQIAYEYDRDERYAGETKYSLSKMIKFSMDGIFSFSNKPLRFALKVGVFSVVFSLSLIIFYLGAFLFSPSMGFVQGWTSLFLAILFFSSVQLFTLGIIGEYISRIYEEVKDRPRYIVESSKEFDVKK